LRKTHNLIMFLLTNSEIEDQLYSPHHPLTAAHYITPNKREVIQFNLTNGELAIIDLRLGELFEDGAWLTVLKYDGETNGLTKDLMIAKSNITPDTYSTESMNQLLIFRALIGAARMLVC
jgi:hypothetical protein